MDEQTQRAVSSLKAKREEVEFSSSSSTSSISALEKSTATGDEETAAEELAGEEVTLSAAAAAALEVSTEAMASRFSSGFAVCILANSKHSLLKRNNKRWSSALFGTRNTACFKSSRALSNCLQ